MEFPRVFFTAKTWEEKAQACANAVGVEKVIVISERGGSGSMVKGSNPSHALLDHHSRRRANDGATLPFRSVVLILSPGRSGS